MTLRMSPERCFMASLSAAQKATHKIAINSNLIETERQGAIVLRNVEDLWLSGSTEAVLNCGHQNGS